MTFPAPRPGLVIRYAFLWSHERDDGADEGAKDRPSAIVVAAPRRENGDVVVVIAPITHAPPADPWDFIEIPQGICRSLGPDERPHWLRLDELNRFAWPRYDLRSIPGRPGDDAYGMLPRPLFEELRQGILNRQKTKAPRVQNRNGRKH